MQKKEKAARGGAACKTLGEQPGDGVLNYAEIFRDEIDDANKMLYYQTEYEAKKRTEQRIKKLEFSVAFLRGLLIGHLLADIVGLFVVFQ